MDDFVDRSKGPTDRFPFATLTDETDDLQSGLRHAMERSERNQFNFEGPTFIPHLVTILSPGHFESEHMELTDYGGGEACIRSYIAEHSFLAVEVTAAVPLDSDPAYILCHWCQALPPSIAWTIDELRIEQLEISRWLVTDWKRGIVIPCGEVHMRSHFDLREYLRVNQTADE